MNGTVNESAATGGRRARLKLHANKARQMFASIPAFLFVIYVGIGVVKVLNGTLAVMHLSGGASAGASKIASPFSLTSFVAAADAIDQWHQWSDRYTKLSLGLPLSTVLMLYLVTDVLLIALPMFLIIRRINRRALNRVLRFQENKLRESTAEESDAATQAAAQDALNRVSGLDGLLRMSFFANISFLALDALEDFFLFAAGTTQSAALIVLTGLASSLKWLALISALLGLTVGLIGSRGLRQDPELGIRTVVARTGLKRTYTLALRIQIGVGALLLVFGALGGDLGRQLDDAFLFPFSRDHKPAYWMAAVAVVLVVSMLLTANLCLRAYLPREDLTRGTADEFTGNRVEPKYRRRTKILVSLGVGALMLSVGGSAFFLKWPVGIALIAPGALLVLVAIYSIFASGETKPDDFFTDTESNLKIGWPYSIAIAVIPLVVLTALAVRNGVRLLTIHQTGYGWGLILGSPPIAIVAGSLIVGLTYWFLRRLGRIDDREQVEAVRRDGRPAASSAIVAGLLALAIFLVMGSSPGKSGTTLGPWGAVFALCIFLALAGTTLVIWSDLIRAWGVVAAAGFRRTPLIAAVLLCFMANAAIDDKYVYHDVRLGAEFSGRQPVGHLGSSLRPDPQIELMKALDQWAEVQRGKAQTRKEIPLVFVASAGGGIRAAYWTALVMHCLTTGDGDACPQQALPTDSIFLASGISGGSLGLAGIHGVPPGTDWLSTLKQDFLGPTVAAMAFRDLPNSLLRINIHDWDRAAVLEQAWETAAGGRGKGLDRGFLETAYNDNGTIAFPLLELNGTSVTDGCRVAVSALDLSTTTQKDGKALSSAADCLALNQQRFAEPGVALPVLPSTKDAFDNTCSGTDKVPHDIRLSTAALLSARFPYVSPTGALHSCTGSDRTFDLDGGLIEPSGALPLAMIWPEVVRWLNMQGAGVCFAPKLIIMENGYLSQTKSEPPAHPSELAAPVAATVATQAAAAPTARQEAAFAFEKSFAKLNCGAHTESGTSSWNLPSVVDFYPVAQPGIEAPLGWTLSYYSQQSLEGQIKSDRNRCSAAIVAAWFSGSTTEAPACSELDKH